MRRFWNWEPDGSKNNGDDPAGSHTSRVLHINGVIAEESWFDDDVTPGLFASELNSGSGDVILWLNSPGGDVVAAAQIYNMLLAYPGQVKVCIDGIAASAASVIAMAGATVAMSPVSMLMIHNPATLASGDKDELARAMSMLDAVKDSIINAYEQKTGMSRAKLSRLMDAETWMDAKAAIQMGFADEYLTRNPTNNPNPDPDADTDFDAVFGGVGLGEDSRRRVRMLSPSERDESGGVVFSGRAAQQSLVARLSETKPSTSLAPAGCADRGRRLVDLYSSLIAQPH